MIKSIAIDFKTDPRAIGDRCHAVVELNGLLEQILFVQLMAVNRGPACLLEDGAKM